MLLNVARAKSIMDAEGVDAVVASTVENNYYLTGVWALGQEMFPRDAEFYSIAPAAAPEAGVIVSSIGEADLTLLANKTIRGVHHIRHLLPRQRRRRRTGSRTSSGSSRSPRPTRPAGPPWTPWSRRSRRSA